MAPFIPLLYFAPSFMRCQRACILPYDKQTYTRLPVMMAQMSCYDHSHSHSKTSSVCECVIGITTRLLCYSPTHLTFIHHPSFLPSLPDSPLIEIYYPHPATGPQCQDDHTLCSRNGHTNHSLMQTVLIYGLGYVSSRIILYSSGWICCS